jgi:hypothetical protein
MNFTAQYENKSGIADPQNQKPHRRREWHGRIVGLGKPQTLQETQHLFNSTPDLHPACSPVHLIHNVLGRATGTLHCGEAGVEHRHRVPGWDSQDVVVLAKKRVVAG